VQVRYDAAGGPCAGSDAVFLHAGHSGWQDTVDVALKRVVVEGGEALATTSTPPPPQLPDIWEGALSVPVSRLAAPGHLEIQAAFRAVRPGGGGEAWDAAEGGRNYSLALVSSPAGLAPAPTRRESRALVASLLTRLDALAASGALHAPAASLLRTLAWQGDGPLLRTYEKVRTAPDDIIAAALGGRCGLVAARPGIHAIHISSEMAPFAKVGGLADVVTALARAHQAAGALGKEKERGDRAKHNIPSTFSRARSPAFFALYPSGNRPPQVRLPGLFRPGRAAPPGRGPRALA